MGESRDEYRGNRRDKGAVCPKTEEITKIDGSLI
jgi:hypothetical protein